MIPFLSLRQKASLCTAAEAALRKFYVHCEHRVEQQKLKNHLKKINKYYEMCDQKKLENEATIIMDQLVHECDATLREKVINDEQIMSFDEKLQICFFII